MQVLVHDKYCDILLWIMSNSLADELLADVAEEESNAIDDAQKQETFAWNNDKSRQAGPDESSLTDTSMQFMDESHAHGSSQRRNELKSAQKDENGSNEGIVTNARSLSKLYGNHTLSELLKVRLVDSHQSIEERMSQPPTVITGALEGSEEYFLIVRANNMAVEIDHEMLALHKVRVLTLKPVHSRTLCSAIS